MDKIHETNFLTLYKLILMSPCVDETTGSSITRLMVVSLLTYIDVKPFHFNCTKSSYD